MHIDKVTRRAYNIEPNMCWECYSCVKACPHHAIDVRGYADFAPLGHSVRVDRDEEKGVIAWRIKFRNGNALPRKVSMRSPARVYKTSDCAVATASMSGRFPPPATSTSIQHP